MSERILFAIAFAIACSSKSAQPRPSPTDAVDTDHRATVAHASIEAELAKLEPIGTPPRPIKRKHRSGSCSTTYAPRPERDPNPMCRIPGGSFVMGGVLVDPRPGVVSSLPSPTAVTLRGFDIDQFEVTAAQAVRFLKVHGNKCPAVDTDIVSTMTPCVWAFNAYSPIEQHGEQFVVVEGREEFIVNTFSIEGAMRYCAWVGKQLATSAQWEYAARHDPQTGRDLVYPWGDTWKPNRTCLDGACLREWKRFETMDIAGLFDGTRGRGDGSSPFGLHDTIEGGAELVTACDDPNETCRPGRPCSCHIMITPAILLDIRTMTTYTRVREPGIGAVRCVRPRE